MSKNLIARISVAAIAIPVILWICYQGDLWLAGMVMLFAVLGCSEFLIGEGFRPSGLAFWLSLLSVAVILAWSLRLIDLEVSSVLLLVVFFLISGMLLSIGKRTPAELFQSHSRLIWGIVYIGLLYPFVFAVGNLADARPELPFSGGDALLFLFGLLWVGDTAAMFIGGAVGKHKLAPTVSPNKTIEGFLGGILGAIVIGVVMCFWKLGELPWYHVLLISLGCSVFGQLGDLVESMWKRSIGIKDSSAIIPGHGGVLDRFDSLLFAAPFMWLYFTYVLLR